MTEGWSAEVLGVARTKGLSSCVQSVAYSLTLCVHRFVWGTSFCTGVLGTPLALMMICVALLICRAVTNCTAVARRVLVCIDTRLLVGDYAYVK